jgi:hypothetical protein
MKETVTPEGYKKLTNIYTVVVDGTTPIASVVHSVDDGDTIIPDVEEMKPTKELDNGAIKSANDSGYLEVSLDVDGDYADKTRAFEFELTMPEDSQLVGTIGNGGEPVVLKNGDTFTLADGQTIRFTNVPKVDYTLSQTKVALYTTQGPADIPKNVTVDTTATDENKFVMKLSNISGTSNDPARVTITITNTGDCAGAETVQLYSRDVKSAVERPVKELKAFKKVFLQPGETRQVSLTIDKSALSFYDDRIASWTVEPGDFEGLVGSSSGQIAGRYPFKFQ